MRILAIYRHYWPDATPYARLLKSILEGAAADGHAVTAYAAQPSYNDIRGEQRPAREALGGVVIRRTRLLPERKRWLLVRAINELWFVIRAVMHVLFNRRYDLIVASARPPLLTGSALWLLRAIAGVPYILHLQDIHPECLRAVGKAPRGLIYRVLRAVDAHACRRADRVVTLSRDMAETLRERGLDMSRVSIINNSPLPLGGELPGALPATFDRTDGTPLLLFAGNLGNFQGLECVIDAAKRLARERRFRLVFMGAGAARDRLMARAGSELNRSIFFEPYTAPATAVRAMRASDFGVVSLAKEVYRTAYPSKMMTYLSAGRPVVVLAEPQSEMAAVIAANELGVCAAGHSVEAFSAALRAACDRASLHSGDRAELHLREKCEALFGERRMVKQWCDLFTAQVKQHGGGHTLATPRERAAA